MRSYGITNAAPYSVAPAIGAVGDIYWNTPSKLLYASDGAVWNAVGATAANGLPPGGTAGQFLVKSSATDFAAQWNDPQWSIAGATLTPYDPVKALAVPGPTAAGADQSALRLGSRTQKLRVHALPGLDWTGLTINEFFNGSAWTRDDTAKPSWRMLMRTDLDQFAVERVSASGVGTQPFCIDGAGGTEGRVQISIPTTNTTYDVLTGKYANVTCRAHFIVGPQGQASVRSNIGWAAPVDDTAQPDWALNIGVDGFGVYRSPAGASPAWVTLLDLTNTGALTCPTGPIKAGSAGGTGYAMLVSGDTTNPGYLAIHHPNTTRVAYIGFTGTGGTKTVWQAEAGWGIALSTGNSAFDFYGTETSIFLRGTNRSAVWFRSGATGWYADDNVSFYCYGNAWGYFIQCVNQNPAYINFNAETIHQKGHRMAFLAVGAGTTYLTDAHEYLIGNCDSGASHVYFVLPMANTCQGRTYYFTKWSGNTGLVMRVQTQGGEQIEGVTFFDVTAHLGKAIVMSANYGVGWYRIL